MIVNMKDIQNESTDASRLNNSFAPSVLKLFKAMLLFRIIRDVKILKKMLNLRWFPKLLFENQIPCLTMSRCLQSCTYLTTDCFQLLTSCLLAMQHLLFGRQAWQNQKLHPICSWYDLQRQKIEKISLLASRFPPTYSILEHYKAVIILHAATSREN